MRSFFLEINKHFRTHLFFTHHLHLGGCHEVPPDFQLYLIYTDTGRLLQDSCMLEVLSAIHNWQPKNWSSRELLGNIRQTLLQLVPPFSPSQEGTLITGCTGFWKATQWGPVAVSNLYFSSKGTETMKNENPKLSGRVGFVTQTWLISSACRQHPLGCLHICHRNTCSVCRWQKAACISSQTPGQTCPKTITFPRDSLSLL